MKPLTFLLASALAAGPLAGCYATQRDFDDLQAKTQKLEKDVQDSHAEVAAMRADLDATRQRLDNALRANADSSSDLMSSKQRLNDLAGRFDELQHSIDDVKRDVAATRTEIYGRIDEMKRAEQTTQPAPPPITIPADRAGHWKALEDAHAKKDWPTVRALGPEYANRYPKDAHADEALFFVGDGDLADGRPSSALSDFNRILKLYPHAAVLDQTLYEMGEAYLMMHDCTNAKLAYDACVKRFPRAAAGAQSKAKLQTIAKAPPGLCAPQ